jgi:hypothetical protein
MSAPAQQAGQDFYTFTVICNRCGESLEGRVHLANDLSADDEGEGYHAHKVLMGSGRCFQQVEVDLKFDASRKLLEREIQGGRFAE